MQDFWVAGTDAACTRLACSGGVSSACQRTWNGSFRGVPPMWWRNRGVVCSPPPNPPPQPTSMCDVTVAYALISSRSAALRTDSAACLVLSGAMVRALIIPRPTTRQLLKSRQSQQQRRVSTPSGKAINLHASLPPPRVSSRRSRAACCTLRWHCKRDLLRDLYHSWRLLPREVSALLF